MARKPLAQLHRERYPVDDIITMYQSGKLILIFNLVCIFRAVLLSTVLNSAN